MSSMPSSTSDKDSSNMTSETMDIDRYPVHEETYLQQSKRSIYYKTCKAKIDKIKCTFEQKDIPLDSALECKSNCSNEKVINIFYSALYAEYFLINWCDLLPLWTSLHLGNQGRHGSTEVYEPADKQILRC